MLFKTRDVRKIRRRDRKIHKAMIITVDIHEINKNFTVIVHPQNSCRLEFADHLWIPFLDQPQYDIVVFAIFTFQIYKIIVSKWKHGIGYIGIITFNEELYFLSTSTIELGNIDESPHEDSIVIFIKNKDLNMTGNNYVTDDDNGN